MPVEERGLPLQSTELEKKCKADHQLPQTERSCLPKIHMRNPTPEAMVFGGRAFGR